MSKASATRSGLAAVLVIAAMGLWLATPAQASLKLALSSSSTSIVSSLGISGSGTSTIYLYEEVGTTTGLGYSGNALTQFYGKIISNQNNMLATAGSSGITGFSINSSWVGPTQIGSANTAGSAGAQGWGAETAGGIIFANASTTGALVDALHAGGSNGFQVNSDTWAFLIGQATFTVNPSDLTGASGSTVTYVSSLTSQSTVKAKWWQTDKGTTIQLLSGSATSNATSGATGSANFVITYTSASAPIMTLKDPVTLGTSTSLTVIQGFTPTFNLLVGNAPTATGPLTGGGNVTGSGVFSATNTTWSVSGLGIGSSTTVSQGVTPSTYGVGALVWHPTDSGGGPTPGDVTDNLTVLAPASPSALTASGTSIGNVLGGAYVTAVTGVSNAANPVSPAGTRAGLNLYGLSAHFGTSTSLVAPGGSATLTATILTNTASYVNSSFNVSFQDDQAYAGLGAATHGSATFTVTGTVANALATGTTFVPSNALQAVVGTGSTMAGLFSVVDKSQPGNAAAVGTQATILASAALGGTATVAMNWRQATVTEQNLPHEPIITDVMQLTGLPAEVPYVLAMTLNDALPQVGPHSELVTLVGEGRVYLVSGDGTPAENWQNAVNGNIGPAGTFAVANFNGAAGGGSYADYVAWATAHNSGLTPTLSDQLGAWGVDTTSGAAVVWAVLNHASDFAAVPEPATLAFLLIGGLTMASAGAARRRNRKIAK